MAIKLVWTDAIVAARAAACTLLTLVTLRGPCGCGFSPRDCATGAGADSGEGGGSYEVDSGGGTIIVNPTITSTVCPSVNPIGIAPENGGRAAVSTTYNGSLDDASLPTLTWMASSGSFLDPHALGTTFLCAATGVVVVTLTVSAPGCVAQTVAGSVPCSGPAGP